MTGNVSSGADRDRRLDEVLAAYLEAVEADPRVDRDEWLRRYPDLAVELQAFFANRDRLAPLAAPTVTFVAGPQEGQPEVAAHGPEPQTGASFGHFEILDEIARGGMGIVYRARQVGLNRVVALKMILAEAVAGPRALRRFRAEAEAAAGLDHPNIVPVYEVGEHAGHPYFAMKLVEGVSLAQWIAGRRLPDADLSKAAQRQIARLLATVVRAVHHAHQRGVLHRDLKPGNILLSRKAEVGIRKDESGIRPDSEFRLPTSELGSLADFEPMVTDFGLAKRAGPDGAVSQSLSVVGTASYMPPEQARAGGGTLTVAADVYSLGAVLYELLTGAPPFQGATCLDTLIQVVEEPVVPPRRRDRRIDADLEKICCKCLQKAPADRYASAAALADDLERWVAGKPVSVRPPGPAERLWLWCRRNPPVAVLTFAVAGLAGAGAALAVVVNVRLTRAAHGMQRARDEAERHAREAEANAAEAARNAGREADARRKADAALERERRALREEKTQRALSRQLLVRQYVSNGAALLDDGNSLEALAWLGEALNLEQGDDERERPHRVRLAAALRHCPRLIQMAAHEREVGAFCVSADCRHLFTAERDGLARLWDTATDRTTALRLRDGSPVSHASFSPDGRLLAVAHGDGQVSLWDVAAGHVVGRPIRHGRAVTCLEFTRDGRRLLSAGRDGTARVWDTAAGKPLCPPLPQGAEVTFATFSPDGAWLVSTGPVASDGRAEARVWDWAAAKQVCQPLRHRRAVLRAVFSPDRRRLYTSSQAHNVRGWDLTTGKPFPVPVADTGPGDLWFGPDGQRVLVGQGMSAQVFDLSSGQPLGRALTHAGAIVAAAFSADGRQVGTAGWDRVVRVWDTASGQPLTPPLRHPRRVSALGFDGGGRRLVTGCEDCVVRLWDLRSRDQAAPPLNLQSAGDVLAVGPGAVAVLAVRRGVARVRGLAGERPVRAFPTGKPVRAVFSPDAKHLATLDNDSLRLWSVADNQWQGRVLRPGASVLQTTFSPDGRCVVARLAGDELRVWDTAAGAERLAAKLPGNSPWDPPVISPDGSRIVTLKFRQFVQVANLATGKPALPALRHTATVINAAYSPDGLRLATACADGTAHVWDAQTGEPATPPITHGQHLHGIGFSLDGRYLATAGDDGAARVWETATGQPVTPWLRQTEPVTNTSFSPAGDRLATAGPGGVVRTWDLNPDRRPVADLLVLTRLLSGQKLHAVSGSLVPSDLAELRQSWPQLRARFPVEFGQE